MEYEEQETLATWRSGGNALLGKLAEAGKDVHILGRFIVAGILGTFGLVLSLLARFQVPGQRAECKIHIHP
jgi:hypothetical protein